MSAAEMGDKVSMLKVRSVSGSRRFIFYLDKDKDLSSVFEGLKRVYGKWVTLEEAVDGGSYSREERGSVEALGMHPSAVLHMK